MTELRKRMIECLQLRGLSARTQESYVRAVRQLAEHYHKSPDLISEEELRQYFLFIKNVKHYSCPYQKLYPACKSLKSENVGQIPQHDVSTHLLGTDSGVPTIIRLGFPNDDNCVT